MRTNASIGRDVVDEVQWPDRRQKALASIFGEQFVQSFASPYMVIEDHVIECPVAVRFYKKDFSYLSKQLYVEYQFRSWKGYDLDLLASYTELVTRKLENIKTLINNTALRLQRLLDQEGHEANLSLWPAPHRCDVPIIALQARSYLEVLRLLDKVYLLAATANLLGVIDSSQRAEAEYICRKAVRAFRSVLQSEVAKLYLEAKRVMRERNGAGQVDPQISEVVLQQGKASAEFDAAGDEEDSADSHLQPPLNELAVLTERCDSESTETSHTFIETELGQMVTSPEGDGVSMR